MPLPRHAKAFPAHPFEKTATLSQKLTPTQATESRMEKFERVLATEIGEIEATYANKLDATSTKQEPCSSGNESKLLPGGDIALALRIVRYRVVYMVKALIEEQETDAQILLRTELRKVSSIYAESRSQWRRSIIELCDEAKTIETQYKQVVEATRNRVVVAALQAVNESIMEPDYHVIEKDVFWSDDEDTVLL